MEPDNDMSATAYRNRGLKRVHRLLLALCWLALLPITTAQASNLLIEQGVLTDTTGTLTIDDLAQADFTPLKGVFNDGYSDKVHWLRLVVQPRADGGAVKLRIRPSFLDELQLFEADPTRPGYWQVRTGGDRYLADDSERGINSLGFLVQPSAPASTYYLRLRTSSTSLLHVQALAPVEAARLDSRQALWNFAYMALLIWIIAWGIQDFAQYRQPVVGCFVLYQCSNLLYTFSLLGYLTVFEPPGWDGFSDRLTSLAVLWVTPSALLFHLVLLRPYRPARWLLYGVGALLGLALLLPLIYLAGWQRQALQGNVQLGLLVSLLVALLPFSTRHDEGVPSLRYIRILYLVLLCAQLLFLLPFLGLVGAAAGWTLQSPLMQGLLTALLMFYMLLQRSRLLRQELAAQSTQANAARLQLEQEKNYAQSLGRFIDMLTHEIKTPLAVAVMNLGATQLGGPYMERARRALDNIDAIIERTRLSELAEHRRLHPQPALSNVSELVYECIESSVAPERIEASVGFALEAHTDAGLLAIIVANLVDNALKYAPADAQVTLSLQRENDGLLLRICNAVGTTGLPDAQQLFDKFYRSPTAASQSGSGLGLYLSHHLAEMLGAQLAYHPRDNAVEFTLWIPL